MSFAHNYLGSANYSLTQVYSRQGLLIVWINVDYLGDIVDARVNRFRGLFEITRVSSLLLL